MKSLWQSLIWKEWHENKWTLCALTGAIATTPWVLRSQGVPGGVFSNFTISFFCYVVIASSFVGMRVASREHVQGTMGLMQVLPSSVSRLAVIKLLTASLVVVLPMFVALLGIYLWYCSWEWLGVDYSAALKRAASERAEWWSANWFLQQLILMPLCALSILFWIAAWGVNRSDEIRAGAIGIATAVGSWAILFFVFSFLESANNNMEEVWARWIVVALPMGIASLPRAQWYEALPAILSLSILAVVFVFRFGTVLSVKKGRRGPTESVSYYGWLPPPRSSTRTALVWKQARQTLPLALMTFGSVVLFALVVTWVGGHSFRNLVEIVVRLGGSLAVLVVLVAGIGIFLDDLEPQINTFWRSRPANPTEWYLVKYLTAVLALTIGFGVPLAVFGLIKISLTDYESNLGFMAKAMLFGGLALLLFTMAATYFCLTRQPVYAAVFSLATFGIGLGTLDWFFDEPISNFGIVLIFLSLILPALWLGFWAFKNDIYLKR